MLHWTKIFLIIFLIYLIIDLSYQRSNLAQRHPCYATNKLLEPFINWTEHLVSSQYGGEEGVV